MWPTTDSRVSSRLFPTVSAETTNTIRVGTIFEPKSCEAPTVWKRLGEDKWVLMYDVYSITPHNFAFTETSDFITFKNLGRFNEGVMKSTNFNAPKHGAVVHLTTEEADKLEAYWSKNKRKYVSTASIQRNPFVPRLLCRPGNIVFRANAKILRLSHNGRYTGMGRHELQRLSRPPT